MRHWRTAIVLLSVLGLLVQAALVVRHSTSMLANNLLQGELSKLHVMCKTDGSSQQGAPLAPDAPVPGTEGQSPDCPICQGLGCAVAVVPDRPLIAPVVDRASARLQIVAEIITRRMAAERPPPTGPPQAA
jgi:hypothetical protein